MTVCQLPRRNGTQHRVLNGRKGVQDLYDQMADRYDTSEHLRRTRRIEEAEARVIDDWLDDLQTPVLDAGCGTGRYTGKIAEMASTVISLDFSLRMLKKAEDRLEKHIAAGRVHPVQGDGEHISLREESVAALICTLTFDHFEDCQLGASEFSRVLKQGGFCILSTFNSRTLSDVQRRLHLPPDKIVFETEDMQPTLVHEVGHSADEVGAIFSRNNLSLLDVRGCCFWHLLPLFLLKRYNIRLDGLLNRFRPLRRYAEIHVTRMAKGQAPTDRSKPEAAPHMASA